MDLKEFNKEQYEAVIATMGPVLILAGAGSGKTRVLTTRIAYLVKEMNVDASNILAITFTNKAAKEMRERVIGILGSIAYKIQISTFHSFGVLLVRENYEKLGYQKNFTIIDSDDTLTIIKKILKELGLDPKDYNPRYIKNMISSSKNELIGPEDYGKYASDEMTRTIHDVYIRYQKKLFNSNSLDFDDLLTKPIELFRKYPDTLKEYQERFKYILIDEYQDTNEAQYVLAKMLSARYRNIFVVGDNDQCLVNGTKIRTLNGEKNIEQIKVGDKILSAIGKGETDYIEVNRINSRKYSGNLVKITTERGKKITATPNHVGFAKINMISGKYYIYLMYKKELGYRIGQTSSVRNKKNKVHGLMGRLNGEHADKIWIIKVCDDKYEANYYEEYYASYYGIPKIVFHEKDRNVNITQDLINKLFQSVDTEERALKLMNDCYLFKDYPHHYASAITSLNVTRKIITLTYLSGRKYLGRNHYSHRISLNTTCKLERELVKAKGYKQRDGKSGTWRIETERVNYDDLYELGINIKKDLSELSEYDIKEKIRILENDNFMFMPIGSFREKMGIAVYDQGKLFEDKIEKIEYVDYDNYVYDLSLDATRNYIANDIAVHNCIYGFRGSNYKNILNFEKDYKDALVIMLEKNYRSTKNILGAANDVIKHNNERKDKNLWTDNEEGEKVRYHRTDSELDEAFYTISEIRRLVNSGIPRSSIAVLYRTNAQSRNIEDALLRENIPYKVVGSFYFYNRKEIKDLISYLKVIYNTSDDVSVLRVINVPKRGIGDKTIDNLTVKSASENKSIFDSIESGKELEFKKIINQIGEKVDELSLTELIDYILEKSGIRKEYEDIGDLDSEIRLENLEEFKSITSGFEQAYGSASLEDFLTEISLVADVEEHKNNTDVITLMTIHSSKGLEFEYVFLVGLEEGVFPHNNSLMENNLEEERRLCYVAMTRARRKLYILNAKRRMLYGVTNENMPSRFIKEISDDYLETDEILSSNFKMEDKYDENISYAPGEHVIHDQYGVGVVISEKGKILNVAFKNPYGIKMLIKGHKSIRKVN